MNDNAGPCMMILKGVRGELREVDAERNFYSRGFKTDAEAKEIALGQSLVCSTPQCVISSVCVAQCMISLVHSMHPPICSDSLGRKRVKHRAAQRARKNEEHPRRARKKEKRLLAARKREAQDL